MTNGTLIVQHTGENPNSPEEIRLQLKKGEEHSVEVQQELHGHYCNKIFLVLQTDYRRTTSSRKEFGFDGTSLTMRGTSH